MFAEFRGGGRRFSPHLNTPLHRDKFITVSAPPYYAVDADNNRVLFDVVYRLEYLKTRRGEFVEKATSAEKRE